MSVKNSVRGRVFARPLPHHLNGNSVSIHVPVRSCTNGNENLKNCLDIPAQRGYYGRRGTETSHVVLFVSPSTTTGAARAPPPPYTTNSQCQPFSKPV